MEFECFRCGHKQKVSERKIKGREDYWRCCVCWAFNMFPKEFKGGFDNRGEAYLKRHKWFKDNVISKKPFALTARRDK